MEAVGNFLDSEVGRFELRFSIHNHHVGNNVGYRSTGPLLDDQAEMLRGNTQLTCIKGGLSMGRIMFHD